MINLIGDSHTDIFRNLREVDRFEFDPLRGPVLFTNRRFLDQSDRELWDQLDEFFLKRSNRPTVVCSGEIDIRAHYWRHIPRFWPLNPVEWIKQQAQNMADGLKNLLLRYNLENVVLWGAPPAQVNENYNPNWPFVGHVATRNLLIDIYNRCMMIEFKDHPRLRLATAFYEFVDLKTYQSYGNYHSHDGVHYRPQLGLQFWNNYVLNNNLKLKLDIPKVMYDVIDTADNLHDKWLLVDSPNQNSTYFFHDQWKQYFQLVEKDQQHFYSKFKKELILSCADS